MKNVILFSTLQVHFLFVCIKFYRNYKNSILIDNLLVSVNVVSREKRQALEAA
jgi:hypothetical protein